MNEQKKRIDDVAASVTRVCMASGLTWEEAITALGVAAKTLAISSAAGGLVSTDANVTKAREQLEVGLQQDVKALVRLAEAALPSPAT